MTIDALAPAYTWLKALHVIAVIAWMAGLLYLPRLFVNHYRVPAGGPESLLLDGMERRLLRAIMNPAMIAVWIFGLALALTPGVLAGGGGWWHAKLACVLAMTGFHMYLARSRRRIEAGERPGSETYWRAMNELPTLLMIVIVVMVIVKPF